MVLNILIPTIVGREPAFDYITNKLQKQIDAEELGELVSIISLKDNREMSIGEKRNSLLESSDAMYVCFIDDDDDVSDTYVSDIFLASTTNPDCIGIIGIITFDGINPRPFHHSIKYDSYFEKNSTYYRPPNHLNPIKSSIAKKFKFPTINHGEDTDWAMQICRSKLIETEQFINKPLYFYKYVKHK